MTSAPASVSSVTSRRRRLLARLRPVITLSPRHPDEKIGAILRSGWFLGLRRGEIELLARTAELVDFDAGETVARSADAGRWWWLPLDGRLRGSTADGFTFVLAPGRGCGMGRSWKGAPPVTLTAVDHTRVLIADRPHLMGATDVSRGVASVFERSVAWYRGPVPASRQPLLESPEPVGA